MTSEHQKSLRRLPAVERVLNRPDVAPLCTQFGRRVATSWIRQILAQMRSHRDGRLSTDAAAIEDLVVQQLHEIAQIAGSQRLRKVINGTGIVIHTNLGRAPLAAAAIEAMTRAAACTNLEVDLASGHRSKRGGTIEFLCQQVTGAEAALVVNNCAAATLLALQTLAVGRRVIISRGQLIEIGGSFRLPDVFRQAGVELHEVGTTNRTRLADYAEAIGPETAALLRVHPSNYRISGYSESVSIAELVNLGKRAGLPVIDDVGSGCLYDLTRCGLSEEPVVRDSVRLGADAVLFSGDKLLGGPQCGIIVGCAELVAKMRSNPLARALRVDKLTLAALEATLEIHRAGRAFAEIPVLRQLTQSADELHSRAERLLALLHEKSASAKALSICEVDSAPGGGALPDQTVPSWAIAIASGSPDQVSRQLRLGNPAVFARVQEKCTLIDLRTVDASDDEALLNRMVQCSLE
ncbi:MAG: L-seryl-tRNA(Sec) selenium transferase [Pirellulales bacterium]|nr:L-seryl-tRNA(Sec) selenium transferase [Pirellulales bacterium]